MQHAVTFEGLVVAEAYEKRGPGEWVVPLFHQVVIAGNERYLDECQQVILMPPSVYTEVYSLWKALPEEERQDTASSFRMFLETCTDQVVAHRIANECGLRNYAQSLEDSNVYLKDQLGT